MNVQKAIFCGSRVVPSASQKINAFGVKEMTGVRSSVLLNNKKTFHVTAQVKYPAAKNLPLPNNIEAIMSAEIGQFSPQRSRDITGPVLFSQSRDTFQGSSPVFSKSFNQFLESYDCKGAVSLNSSMQSNVPSPYKATGNAMYLNMPGGQWDQGSKYISEDMQKKMYYLRVKNQKKQGIQMFHTLSNNKIPNSSSSIILRRFENTKSTATTTLTRKEKLKRAVAEYGSTVVVFHVGISLISLGACYTLVSSGLDMETFMSYLPWTMDASSSKVTKTAGTFVTAYAIHKVMAPVRIGITLSSVPFIVRYLRKIGFLKPR